MRWMTEKKVYQNLTRSSKMLLLIFKITKVAATSWIFGTESLLVRCEMLHWSVVRMTPVESKSSATTLPSISEFTIVQLYTGTHTSLEELIMLHIGRIPCVLQLNVRGLHHQCEAALKTILFSSASIWNNVNEVYDLKCLFQ